MNMKELDFKDGKLRRDQFNELVSICKTIEGFIWDSPSGGETINGKDYIDFILMEDPKYVAKCAEDIYLLINYLNGIDSIIIDIDKFCSEITQIINASIDHGGDHGGPYCIDSDDFGEHLNQFIKNLGLDDKVKILYDSYGHFMSIMPKNRRE